MYSRYGIIIFSLLFTSSLFAQNIYIYPNKKLYDEGLLEYRAYTPDEAEAYMKGGSFEQYLVTDWSDEQRLTEDEDAYAPKVAAVGDSIFCTYQEIGNGPPYAICSYDAGLSWINQTHLGDTLELRAFFYPELAEHNGELMVGACLYQYSEYGYNLAYFRSTDRGTSWGDLETALPYHSIDRSNFSSFCNVGQKLYFSYNDEYYDSIYVLISNNWGQNWNGRGKNVAYLTGTIQPMAVRAYEDNVYLVWVNLEGTISVHYSRSTDAGLTWSVETEFSDDPDGAQVPFIAVADTHIVVCWMGYKYSDEAFTGDLFIKRSFDSGDTWEEEQVIVNSEKVGIGSVYVEDSMLVATWQDKRFENSYSEAMAIYSTDYGDTWSDERRLSHAEYDSHSPIACMTDDKIHVLWGDMRLNAPGLYYAYNDLSTGIYDSGEILPEEYSHLSSYPNPFNSSTIINYSNLEGGEIEIYNITGQLVKTLNISNRKEGQVTWDATDAMGNKVSSGIYFARAKSGGNKGTIKLVYLR